MEIGLGASALMEGAAVVATERLERKAKIREEMLSFCTGGAP